MDSLYPAVSAGVNWSALSPRCISFCRWLYRWYHQTGNVSPSTDYFAYKQGKCRRQVYRWLAALEAVGAIRRDNAGTHDREIIPLEKPPKKTNDVTQNVTQNVTRLSYIDSVRRNATTMQCLPSPVVGGSGGCPQLQSVCHEPVQSKTENPPHRVLGELEKDLASLGVSIPVAVALVADSPEQVAQQIAALPFRQAKDKAAVLVASIKNAWPIPSAFTDAVATQKKQAAKAQNDALRAELSKKRETTRHEVKSRFSGLPDALRAEYLDRADALLRFELPDVYKLMQNRHPDTRSAWLTTRAISLMEGGQ